jgi:hypothetical protein
MTAVMATWRALGRFTTLQGGTTRRWIVSSSSEAADSCLSFSYMRIDRCLPDCIATNRRLVSGGCTKPLAETRAIPAFGRVRALASVARSQPASRA